MLLELGVPGGRTGVRDDGQQASVLAALQRWSGAVTLAGVEVYEGVLNEEADIRAFLRRAVAVTRPVGARRPVRRSPVRPLGRRLGVVRRGRRGVRPRRDRRAGRCRAAPRLLPDPRRRHLPRRAGSASDPQSRGAANARRACCPRSQLWAYVLSMPEPERAIIGLGKRDAAFDAGYADPARRFRPGSATGPVEVPAHWKITGMMDQHAYLGSQPATTSASATCWASTSRIPASPSTSGAIFPCSTTTIASSTSCRRSSEPGERGNARARGEQTEHRANQARTNGS